MRRREFITVLGGAVAWVFSAHAQQPSKPIVGWLGLASERGESEMLSAFRRGLRAANFNEGRNVAIEFRFAEGDVSQLPALAAELASLISPGSEKAGQVILTNDLNTWSLRFCGGVIPKPQTSNVQESRLGLHNL